MEAHPTFTAFAPFFARYSPAVQGAAYQTYNDLLLSQRWADLRVLDLPACVRCAFEGLPPNSDSRAVVVPCALVESISLDWLDRAFEGMDRPEKIFLAIVSDDSSIVYYKLTAGINKPPV
ncbi:hypothetical protein PENSPDRAFT_167002 [Peniophora sp. CONT]|nr:hypothetical protein PENSPDRAFT_167002 [Peniophora sp. CONT]